MKRFTTASFLLSLALLIGRLAGFVREILIGQTLGVSRDADFAVVLLATPDLLVNLLLAGGLSAALIPEFRRLDHEAGTRMFLVISGVVLAVFGALALIIALFPSALMLALAPGYRDVPAAEYAGLFAVMAAGIPLAGLSGVTASFLNAEEKFFVAGAGTLIFNLTLIAALTIFAHPGAELAMLAVGVTAAGALRYASQLVACLPHLSFGASSDVTLVNYRRLIVRFMQALGASTLVLFIPVLLRALISLSGAGNIAAYNFATKIVELPLGIAVTTIATVTFPALSKAVSSGNRAEEDRVFSDGLARSLLFALCIAIPGLYFAHDLVSVVFRRGRMQEQDLQTICSFARIGFLTLPSIAVSSMASARLNALGQTGYLLKVTAFLLLLIPFAALPGILVGDARLTVMALPVFHAAYAIKLGLDTGRREFTDRPWLVRHLARPCLAACIATAVFALAGTVVAVHTSFIGSGLAGLAMLVSIFMLRMPFPGISRGQA